jgi:hypothetical protein
MGNRIPDKGFQMKTPQPNGLRRFSGTLGMNRT